MEFSDTVLINGEGVSRPVWVFDANRQILIAKTESASDGRFSVIVPDDTDSLLIVTIDNMGSAFLPGTAYRHGQLVRPDPFVGLMFVVEISGYTGNVEPEWPTVEGVTVTSGEVVFKAVPHYRPVAKFVPL